MITDRRYQMRKGQKIEYEKVFAGWKVNTKKVYCSKSNFLRKTHLFEKAAHEMLIKFTPEANPTKHFLFIYAIFNAFVDTFGHFLVDTLVFKH